jgi:hypothetical protein
MPPKVFFKGTHFPKDVILYAVFFYVRYGVSYRDLEEIMEERGVNVDHATLNRWVIRYAPAITSLGKCVPLKLIMILFYAHWEIKGGLYQNLSINAYAQSVGYPLCANHCCKSSLSETKHK